MNFRKRLKRLEEQAGDGGVCPACKGYGGPLYRAEFLNGDPPLEGGQCRLCNGVGSKKMPMKQYLLSDRATWDAV